MGSAKNVYLYVFIYLLTIIFHFTTMKKNPQDNIPFYIQKSRLKHYGQQICEDKPQWTPCAPRQSCCLLEL